MPVSDIGHILKLHETFIGAKLKGVWQVLFGIELFYYGDYF